MPINHVTTKYAESVKCTNAVKNPGNINSLHLQLEFANSKDSEEDEKSKIIHSQPCSLLELNGHL